ncbi:MAG: hypothetical protein INH34_00375 [Phycisphaerales bacterium]|jgi:hypothetical protein|nr:hypothetical protein [Phycisphaerales bacterium]
MRQLLATATLVALPTFALAQDAVDGTPPAAAREPDPTARGRFGMDFTTQYFFRGIRQETQGLILQPWGEIGYALTDGNETVRGLDLTFGAWSSLNSGGSNTGEDTDGSWYEGRGFIDLTAGIAEKWTMGLRYTAYGNPNNAARRFRTVQEVEVRAELDDRGYLGDVIDGGLQPYALVAVESAGEREYYNAGITADTNAGIYGELGVNPSFALGVRDDDLRLHVPVKVGLSLSDYYQDSESGKDDFFGYLDVGVEVRQPLAFVPRRLGPWSAFVGVHFLLLGDNCEERNKGSTNTTVSGDETEFILSAGVSTRF